MALGDPCTSTGTVFRATGSRNTDVPVDIPRNTTSVYLHDNRIQIIKTKVFSSLTTCVVLDLHGNTINIIEQAAFYRLSNLENLDLSGNRLTRIWTNMFLGLFSLEELSLDGNWIKTIDDEAFNGLHMLKKLSLKHNKIKAVTRETFRDLIFLERLLLTNNKLTRLGQCTFSDVPRLSLLVLEYNHFDCDEGICWLVKEARQALTLFPPSCRSPRTWENLDCHGPGKVSPGIKTSFLLSRNYTVHGYLYYNSGPCKLPLALRRGILVIPSPCPSLLGMFESFLALVLPWKGF